eukprot:scaffold78286_cov63-Phaeocystis_antarctica.AAC.1
MVLATFVAFVAVSAGLTTWYFSSDRYSRSAGRSKIRSIVAFGSVKMVETLGGCLCGGSPLAALTE